jgi:tetratricopeptide (TPR) repeat protein
MDLLGAAFKEQDLLTLGYAIEQTLKLRRPPFSAPRLVEGKPPAPRVATATFSVQSGSHEATPDVMVSFSYDTVASRLNYTLKASQPRLDQLVAVWLHSGTTDKPGAARHQLFGAGEPLSGSVILSSADRRDLSDNHLLARLYVRDKPGSAGDVPLIFGPEATSLTQKPLYQPSTLPIRQKLEADLEQARKQLAVSPDDPESLIWLGRRYGYLWRFQNAIEAFTSGVDRWPDNPKFYRHRGHRYITIRQFAKAEADLAKAAALVRGKPDEIEPDGAPNAAGKPRSTLQFNIWYHLGLARYLQGNFQGAYDAYVECMRVSTNDDSVVATSDWMWMTLMRLGRKAEAARVLEHVTPKMDILENQSYHRRLLMYKGIEKPEALLDTAKADDTTIATQGYGVGNYYFVTGDKTRARRVFERVVAGSGWNAFGFIAAEAELVRRAGL